MNLINLKILSQNKLTWSFTNNLNGKIDKKSGISHLFKLK